MKLSSSLVLLLGTAIADQNLRGLVLVEEPCLETTADITFDSSCTTTTVMADLEVALADLYNNDTSAEEAMLLIGNMCNHTATVEALMLTGQTTLSAAKKALVEDCVAMRKPCLTSLDDITYNTACTGTTVLADVTTALANTTCQHDARAEAPVLTGTPSVSLATKALQNDCSAKRVACIASLDEITYNSACTGTTVLTDVTTALAKTTCQHDARAEVPVLTGTASVSLGLKALQSDCAAKREACLESLDDITYNSACSWTTVLVDVTQALAGTTCQHDAKAEAPVLTGTASVSEAINVLRGDCASKRQACLTSLYDITYNTACTRTSVLADVATALTGTTCQHDKSVEAPLVTGTDTLSEAINVLRSDCASRRGKCISDLYQDVIFPNCVISTIWSSITAKLVEVGCSHGVNEEVLVQTGLPTVAAAKVDIAAKCVATLKPCLGNTLDDVSLEGVVCTNSGVVAEVQDRLAATTCTHSDQREMMLLTGKPTFAEARTVFVDKCVSQRKPCIEDLYGLDYDNCTQTTVMATIKDKLTELACPHDVNVEVLLQTDEETVGLARQTIMDKCMDTLDPCLTLADIDFYPTNCNGMAIRTQIAETLAAKGTCTHDVTHEIQLLTNTDSTSAATASLVAQCEDARVPCIESLTVDVASCDIMTIINAIKEQFPADSCPHNLNREILLLTDTDSRDEFDDKIRSLCDTAWSAVETSAFTDVDSDFDRAFMSEYVQGDGYLNTETGNFQGNSNPSNPTTARMTQIGQNIAAFRGAKATTTVLESVETLDECEYQSIMCCFGRDRQSNDNNGDCADNDCVDKGPADNSNLCYVDDPDYMKFENADEGSVHCHGLAWDEDPNDATARFRYNNFFFVTLFDHMYQRGYVEDMLDTADPKYSAALPMCGCIEDMPQVTRSDCTQVDVDQTWQLNLDAQDLLTISPVGTPTVNFNACQGNDPSDNGGQNNDLASHVNRLTRQKRMSEETRDFIYSRLVGYLEPGNNNNEAACAAAVAEYEQANGIA